MTRITSAIAAAFIASASFASVALAAEGDYFEGVSKASATVDQVQTGSIGQKATIQADVNSGDYFDGANRPS
ncbi:hypothetical protein [Neorhizobium galegae]|uniref:hypothetical protein n=1 Tax=Neorhizobium galegae TaxID=399 RepID=UPI0006225BE6|nr:hypothetical protein [Neorhizobium galegae]MCQ1835931.1 hypothetical protein [Neorhizobium galegae]UIY28505.1 hypothetical protein LZK73_16855 [Neorhizobium galegae]CDZ69441.1 Hypothetical protein NGAL_HAMBI2610_10400 [Neorhizobium galegae bv. orientalis]